MTKTRLGAPVVGIAALLLLAGCSGTGFSVLDTEQTEEDQLPAIMVDSLELDDYDLASSRFSASYEGVDMYLLTDKDLGMPCLAVSGEGELDNVIVCGGNGEVETSVGGFDVQLVREPAVEADGWTVISDNLRVRD